jgi:hypothetical protein
VNLALIDSSFHKFGVNFEPKKGYKPNMYYNATAPANQTLVRDICSNLNENEYTDEECIATSNIQRAKIMNR